MKAPIICRKWEFRTLEGAYIQVSETEDRRLVQLLVARMNSDNRRMIEAIVNLTKEEWSFFMGLSYRPEIMDYETFDEEPTDEPL